MGLGGAVLDEDGFIDGGNYVFDRLRIFMRHGESSELVALGQRG